MSLSVTNDISQESLKAEVGFLLIKSTFSEFTIQVHRISITLPWVAGRWYALYLCTYDNPKFVWL